MYINRPDSEYIGLFGYTDNATITNIGLTNVDVKGLRYVGGLAGLIGNSSAISASYATGDVLGVGVGFDDGNPLGSSIGGLAGALISSQINTSYATADVSGYIFVGGLAGLLSNSTLNDSYATGIVNGHSRVGGLAGGLASSSTISESHATGEVNGDYGIAGGLAGTLNSSTISESYATGDVRSIFDVGGIAGQIHDSTIQKSYYTTGTLTGTRTLGGLVGTAYDVSSIDNSYAQATIQALASEAEDIGGLVGLLFDNSSVANSYSASSIAHGDDATNVGGLIGSNQLWVEAVEVTHPTNNNITNSFWDAQEAGSSITQGVGLSGDGSIDIAGKTTAEMQSLATFQISAGNWDIEQDTSYSKIYPFLAFTDDGTGGYSATWVIGTYDPVIPDPVDPPPFNEQQQAAQTVAQNTVTQMVSGLTGGNATPTGAPIALTTPQQTPTVGDDSPSAGISGGLHFVAVDGDVAGDGGSPIVAASGTQSGRDISGYMNVFVVRGGINYGAFSSDDN